MRFTTAQRAGIIAGAVASGRIPAAKAAAYQAEIAAGGTRAGTAIAALLASYPAGHPIGAPAPTSAAAAETAIWDALFSGHVAQPKAADADQARAIKPMTEAEYRQMWPEPGSYDPAAFDQPLMPGLAGYVKGPPMPAGAQTPGPQLDQASRGPVRADLGSPQIAPLAIVEHGKVTAWHTHVHSHPSGTEGDPPVLHDHEHVHQSSDSHAAGPGHSHADSPDTYTPELASGQPGGPRPARPFTLRVAAARLAARPGPPAPRAGPLTRAEADAALAAWWTAAQASAGTPPAPPSGMGRRPPHSAVGGRGRGMNPYRAGRGG